MTMSWVFLGRRQRGTQGGLARVEVSLSPATDGKPSASVLPPDDAERYIREHGKEASRSCARSAELSGCLLAELRAQADLPCEDAEILV